MSANEIISVVLVLSASFYSAVVLALIVGVMKARGLRSNEKPFVSVIVAARNEETNLPKLLPLLLHQQYQDYEVIVVDDRSGDRTNSIIRAHRRNNGKLKLVTISTMPVDLPPKKNALAEGIKKSKGQILLFTDADCFPSKTWISEVVGSFEPSVGLVAGFSPYENSIKGEFRPGVFTRFLQKFISYEELKAAAWTAGSIGLSKAWLCTGRNLAYRRKVYDEVGGFGKIKHSVSGDDDLFIQLVRRNSTWKVRYATSPETFVPTAAPQSFSEFVEQRKRHFSAAKYFPVSMKLFFFLFHLSNLLLFAGFLGFLLGISGFLIGLACFAVKLAADVSIFLVISETLRQRGFGSYFLFMEILYIFYNTLIGPLGLIKRFEWKPEPKT